MKQARITKAISFALSGLLALSSVGYAGLILLGLGLIGFVLFRRRHKDDKED